VLNKSFTLFKKRDVGLNHSGNNNTILEYLSHAEVFGALVWCGAMGNFEL